MKKYTDEQLSRILSEHAAGLLVTGGKYQFGLLNRHESPGCCINQAAYNDFNQSDAFNRNREPARWFDLNYWSTMSSKQLLKNIDKE